MELKILDLIQQMRTPWLDFLMPQITKLGDNGIIWIVFTFILLIIPKTRKIGMVMAISLAFNALICNLVLKPLVARTRPCDLNQTIQLLIRRPLDFSFPSGHTSASFATIFALFFCKEKKLAWTAFVVGSLIAFSRLYLYVHFPTDVIAGVVLGALSGYVGYFVMIRQKLSSNSPLSSS